MCQPQKIKIVASVIRNSQFESFYTKIPKSITLNTISGQLTLTAATGIWPLRCLLPFPGFGPLASRKFSMQHDSWRSGGRYGVHLQQRYDKRKLWKITFMVDRFEYFFIWNGHVSPPAFFLCFCVALFVFLLCLWFL